MKSFVLITGAAGGLGRALAAECAGRGWDLFLTDMAEAPLAALAEGLRREHNVSVECAACNLTDEAARAAFWDAVRGRGIFFHMLINVAGTDHEGPFAERDLEELTSIVRLNIESVVAMTRSVLQHRDPVRTLRIINVSSLAAFYPTPVKAVYAASKRFLLDFSLALRRELKGRNATVTALCPAGMPTNRACIDSIVSQGFMGRVTTKNVSFVAERTIDRALANCAVYIPGMVNQLIRRIGGLAPRSLVTAFIGKRWRLDGERPARPKIA